MTIKVLPANPDMLKHLKHPSGIALQEYPVDWPEDQFTFRRLADGSIKQADEATRTKPPKAKQE